jgi:hypothetical protein
MGMESIQIIASYTLDFKLKFPDLILSPRLNELCCCHVPGYHRFLSGIILNNGVILQMSSIPIAGGRNSFLLLRLKMTEL